MASGTLVSRLTGVVRIVALAYALGLHLGDAYNLANNTPNTLYDLLLGGVLASTIVPIFSSRLASEVASKAWRSISSVVTIATLFLLAVTVLFELASPLIIHAYSIGTSGQRSHLTVLLAIDLLRLFAPQLFFYGVISLCSAVLYSQHRFVAPSYTPIVNNLISIAVLLIFSMLYRHPTVASVLSNHGALVLLGVGTSAGVAVQAVLLLPSILRYAPQLRLRFHLRDPAIREIYHLSGWTFGYVVANQVALFVVTAIAFAHSGYVTAYNYAYLFFQLPYAIVSLSIMSAIQPQLASLWALERRREFADKLSSSLQASVTITLPFAVLYVIGASLATRAILLHGAMSSRGANLTAQALAAFALGLPGFAAFLSINQALQATRQARSVFLLYALENSLNIALAFVLVRSLGIFGLALSFSIAYSVGALVGLWELRRQGIRVALRKMGRSWTNSLLASIAAGLFAYPIVTASTNHRGLVLFGFGIAATIAAALGFFAITAIGSRLKSQRGRS
jgi:putative peptidoglycan lipid II flippase